MFRVDSIASLDIPDSSDLEVALQPLECIPLRVLKVDMTVVLGFILVSSLSVKLNLGDIAILNLGDKLGFVCW